MTPNNSSVTSVRLETTSFQKNHDTAPFEAKGWRCFVNQTKGGITWILKRGGSVAMFAQSMSESLVQDVKLPDSADSSELCHLMLKSGIARPV
jgi:hypothetical protein